MQQSPGQQFKTKMSVRVFSCLLVSLALVSVSCGKVFKSKAQREGVNPVARVYDKMLFEADLKGVGAGAATPEDSLTAVKNYIDTWIRQELILRYAEENLPEELDEIEDRIEKYRRQLIVYTYERELVAQKLDTVVTKADVQLYYDKYRDAFSLRTGIFNVNYARLRNAPKARVDSAKKWMQKPSYENNSKLTNFFRQHAVRYVTGDSTWLTQDEIAAVIPMDKIDWERVAFRNGFAEATDSTDLCLLKVNGYKFKGAAAPLAYVRNDIANIIINKRKLDYIDKVHTAIYDDALKSKKFEVFQ